jgi:hypothetical protein
MPTATKRRATKAPKSENLGGISSEAVAKATGKTWPEWIAFLDARKAIELPHKEIAALLHEKYNVPGWWCQMVTVGYEQAKGRRVVGQTCAGDYSANASKTLPLSAVDAHAWLVDEKKRSRWLDKTITLRTATAPKSARFQFSDGSIAGIWVTPKSAAKCSLGVSHDKLPDAKTAAKHKAFWADALSRLAAAAT